MKSKPVAVPFTLVKDGKNPEKSLAVKACDTFKFKANRLYSVDDVIDSLFYRIQITGDQIETDGDGIPVKLKTKPNRAGSPVDKIRKIIVYHSNTLSPGLYAFVVNKITDRRSR